MAEPGYLIVDVYRDGFLLRRETLGAGAATFAIGSSPEARLWLDSTRVDSEHAVLHVDAEGRVLVENRSRAGTFMGRRRLVREELFRGAPLTIPPYVLVVTKRPNDPDPGAPGRNFPPLPVAVDRFKPEPPPPDRSCPRCAVALGTRSLPSTGPAYRTAPAEALACHHCGLLLITAGVLADRIPLGGRLADTPAVRKRSNARGLCPECRTDLVTLRLSWGDTWVAVEECGGCGLVAFDPHELEIVSQIVRSLAARE